jgi:hypothetical protein
MDTCRRGIGPLGTIFGQRDCAAAYFGGAFTDEITLMFAAITGL